MILYLIQNNTTVVPFLDYVFIQGFGKLQASVWWTIIFLRLG